MAQKKIGHNQQWMLQYRKQEYIKEHISYILGSGALAQIEFGNWSSTGYQNEPVHFTAVSYVKDEGRRESWKLSRSHFLLKKHILK